MIVYVDLIILANFLIDYSLIVYTGIITNEPIKLWRILAATLFAVMSLALFFIRMEIIFYLLRFLWSFLIIFIAFKYSSIKKYIINLVSFYFLNFVTAGIIVSYNFQFLDKSILIDLKNTTTWYLLIVSFILANILTYTYKVIENKKAFIKQHLIDIKFKLLNREYITKGLIDTGNLVFSREDHLPVVFVDDQFIGFTMNEVNLIKEKVKFTYVCYKTIKERYLTVAVKPERFEVMINDQFHEKHVYLAVAPNIKGKDDPFQVILNANILI